MCESLNFRSVRNPLLVDPEQLFATVALVTDCLFHANHVEEADSDGAEARDRNATNNRLAVRQVSGLTGHVLISAETSMPSTPMH